MDQSTVVGVVGAGTMGTGIAQEASTFGHKVYLYDTSSDQLNKSKHGLRKILQRQVEKDRMTQQEVDNLIGRINFVDDLTDFGECGIVFEAIIEDEDAKKDAFSRVEGIVPNDCILATNTSSLSVAAVSSALKKPKRFLGMHFFNPVPLMPLVEIVPGISTNDETAAEAKQLMDDWGKTPAIAKDTPGFIVNRVARPFYGESLRIFEEGLADAATIDWAMKEIGGFKMGPFELMDFIGHDVNYKTTVTVFEEFYYDPRFRPSFAQKRLVQAGYLGRKTGKGFYEYGEDAEVPDPVEDYKLGQEIVDRVVSMLINEAADAVYMNVATIKDIDLAMTKGVNYPKGLLAWADEIGPRIVLDRISDLHTKYRDDRYRPNPLLKQMVHKRKTFYK